ARERAIDRGAHGGQGLEWRLVAGQAHERLLLGVAAGGGIGGDATDPLGELDRHPAIVTGGGGSRRVVSEGRGLRAPAPGATARRLSRRAGWRLRRGRRARERDPPRRGSGSARGSRETWSAARGSPARTAAARGRSPGLGRPRRETRR